MPLQKGRLKTYLIPHAFLQGHFENSKEMNGSVFFFFFFFLICWAVPHPPGGCAEEQLAFFKILDGPSLWDRSISQKCNSSAMTVWGYFSSNPLSRLRGCPHHIPRPFLPLSFTLFLLSLQVWIWSVVSRKAILTRMQMGKPRKLFNRPYLWTNCCLLPM